MALILWQYLKMTSFSELIDSFNCKELRNCQDSYYADVDGSVFELL